MTTWRPILVVLAVLALAGAACGRDDGATSTTAVPTAAPATTVATTAATTGATTVATTAAATTTVAATTVPATTAPPSTACAPFGSTEDRRDAFPERYSSLVGQDLRTGKGDCYERVVIELAGTGDVPGWWVRLLDGPPILDPLGEPATMRGNAFLEITLNVWMPDPFDGRGYQGPKELFPEGYEAFQELERTENFEGQTSWAVGLDRARPFKVLVLSDPVRLVVDVAVP